MVDHPQIRLRRMAAHGARTPLRAPRFTGCRRARVAPEVIAGVPSVHAAWNGSYQLIVDGHSLKLEEEVFLVLNAGHVLTTRGRRDPGSCLLSIYFAPELLDAGIRRASPRRIASAARALARRLVPPVRASARVRPLVHAPSCTTSRITSVRGSTIPLWYEEQVGFLLRRLLAHEISLARTVCNMTHMKSWKRRETFTRLARVTDLIHSCYERRADDRRTGRSCSLVALSHDARVQGGARHQPVRISAATPDTNGRSPAVLDRIVRRGNRRAHRFSRTQYARASLASQPRCRRTCTAHTRSRQLAITARAIDASDATQNANDCRIRCEFHH